MAKKKKSELRESKSSPWVNIDPPKQGKVLYSYYGSEKHELSIKENDLVEIIEEASGWYRGRVLKDDNQGLYGIFPASYILCSEDAWKSTKYECFKQKLKLKSPDDKLLFKLTKLIIKWNDQLSELIGRSNFAGYTELTRVISDIMEYRTIIQSPTISNGEKERARGLALLQIAKGRRVLGLDCVPYSHDGYRLDFINTPIIRLYSAHQEFELKEDGKVRQFKMKKTPTILHGIEIQKTIPSAPLNYHLHINFKCLIAKGEGGKNGESEISIFIYDLENKKQLSEIYHLNLGTTGIKDLQNVEHSSAIFVDFSPDAWKSTKLYVVCRIIKISKFAPEAKSSESVRRPGFWSFENLNAIRNHSHSIDFSLPLYSPINELSFGKGPHYAIKNSGHYSTDEMGILAISCRMLRGPLESYAQSEPNLLKAKVCRRLEIPDWLAEKEVVVNDFYITLSEAIFVQERKYNSFELAFSLRYPTGEVIKDCCGIGIGEELTASYRSVVYLHNNFPQYSEIFRFQLPRRHGEMVAENIYLYVEVRQWSTKEKLPESKFAAIFPIVKDYQVIPNDKYNLEIFKSKSSSVDINLYNKNEIKYESLEKYRITIETSFISSLVCQNPVILNLINWKKKPETLADSLNKITFVPIDTILQFMHPIFDNLLMILEMNPKIKMFAYNTLIFVISLIIDDKKTDRYVNLLARLQAHINSMYKRPKVSEVLLESILYYFSRWDSNSHAKYIRSTLRVLPFLMKIIFVHSNIISSDSLKSGSDDDDGNDDSYSRRLKTTNSNFPQNRFYIEKSSSPISNQHSSSSSENNIIILNNYNNNINNNQNQKNDTTLKSDNHTPDLDQHDKSNSTSASPSSDVTPSSDKINVENKLEEEELPKTRPASKSHTSTTLPAPSIPITRNPALTICQTESKGSPLSQSRSLTHIAAMNSSVSPSSSSSSSPSSSPSPQRKRSEVTITPIHQTTSIKQNFFKIFQSLGELMQLTDPVMIAPQTTCYKSLCDLIPILSAIFSHEEIATIICDFIRIVPQHSSPTPTLNIQKLMFIQAVINHDFYLVDIEITESVIPHLLNVISLHINRSRNESVECSRCLIILLDAIQTKANEKERVFKLFASILKGISLLIIDVHGENQVISLDYVTSFVSILHGISMSDFDAYLRSFPNENAKLNFIQIISSTLLILLQGSYPESWIAMEILLCKVIVDTVKVIAKHLPASMESNLPFIDFFLLCFEFLKLKLLNTEDKNKYKNSLITSISRSDMRLEIAEIIRYLWNNNIGRKKVHFISTLVEPLVSLLLVDQPEIKKMAIEMYGSLLQSEFEVNSNFLEISSKTVESFCQISKIEGIAKCNTSLLMDDISKIFENWEDDKLRQNGKNFILQLKQLVDLLLDSEQIPSGIEWEDERTVATFKVMEFLKHTKHPDPYVKYIHQLSTQHKKAHRFTEAGLTLLLHASLLSFSSPICLRAFMKMPVELEYTRKENLFMKAVRCFDKGKEWERAIDLLREICISLPPNYEKLASNLRLQADLYDKIVNTERYPPEYFRVCFYGKFPPSLKGQEFIYRGFECERITSFISRMSSLFPNAGMISSNDPISDDIINGDRQWMVIATVYVSSEGEMNRNKMVVDRSKPLYIRKYEKFNNVNVFTYSRPFSRSPSSSSSSPDNEFKNLWTKLFFLKTEETFPAILSRSKVVQRIEVDLNPIESAILSIEHKNNQILDICALHSDPSKNNSMNSLTMALNGFIDAEVNGGVKKYQQAFFNEECLNEYENAVVLVQQLKDVLRESVDVLGNAMEIHRKKCPENLLKLQEKLDGNGLYIFISELSLNNINIVIRIVFYERMKCQILEFS